MPAASARAHSGGRVDEDRGGVVAAGTHRALSVARRLFPLKPGTSRARTRGGGRRRSAALPDGEEARRVRDRHRVDRREAHSSRTTPAPTRSSTTRRRISRSETRRITGGAGVHVVYDSVGQDDVRQVARLPRAARHARAVRPIERTRAAVRSADPQPEGIAVPDAPDARTHYVATRDELLSARERPVRLGHRAASCTCGSARSFRSTAPPTRNGRWRDGETTGKVSALAPSGRGARETIRREPGYSARIVSRRAGSSPAGTVGKEAVLPCHGRALVTRRSVDYARRLGQLPASALHPRRTRRARAPSFASPRATRAARRFPTRELDRRTRAARRRRAWRRPTSAGIATLTVDGCRTRPTSSHDAEDRLPARRSFLSRRTRTTPLTSSIVVGALYHAARRRWKSPRSDGPASGRATTSTPTTSRQRCAVRRRVGRREAAAARHADGAAADATPAFRKCGSTANAFVLPLMPTGNGEDARVRRRAAARAVQLRPGLRPVGHRARTHPGDDVPRLLRSLDGGRRQRERAVRHAQAGCGVISRTSAASWSTRARDKKTNSRDAQVSAS